ncbi:hypothetical protein O0I10_004180 [Lichtheimia ornata]|uniref:Uncharacterized protein n=1 Tax=Lichtheimia ornata TaxID=688661 RepID=A0AAD7V6P8_9FUNG|nr:uncharacterized protein O0I10_004180 [Lichtheimia ornata]KAJ8659954.1 hypothetical protein O0I10_004180 [Lichtheimia ornata]
MTQASIAIQHLEHVGLWYLWQQQDTDLKARMLYGWLNGMRGIGSTKQNMLINELYMKQQHDNMDGMEIRFYLRH